MEVPWDEDIERGNEKKVVKWRWLLSTSLQHRFDRNLVVFGNGRMFLRSHLQNKILNFQLYPSAPGGLFSGVKDVKITVNPALGVFKITKKF